MAKLMNDDAINLKTLKRITWRTAISGRLQRFSALIENQDVFQKYFGEKFVEQLSTKIECLNRNVLLLGVAYTVLMVSLFFSQDSKKTEFEIFGYGFKNLGYHKEFLLFLAAGLSPISATLSVYKRYLIAIRKECLKKLAPDPAVRGFYSYVYDDSYFDPLLKETGTPSSRPHGLAVSLLAIFGFVLVLLLLALLAASFLLQVNVIYDVATNPASSKYVNLFVVAFSLSAISLSWVIGLLQLPLPEVDLSNYTKLTALRELDKAKYEETMRRITAESDKRERAWSAVLSLVFFVISYSAVAILWYPATLEDIEAFIARALPGAFLTTVVSSGVTLVIKRVLYRWFFRRYPSESEHRLTVFVRLGKILTATRFVTPITAAVAYAIFVLRSQ